MKFMLFWEDGVFSTILTGFYIITPRAITGRPVGTLGYRVDIEPGKGAKPRTVQT